MPHHQSGGCTISSGSIPVTAADIAVEVKLLQQSNCPNNCGWVYGRRIAEALGAKGYSVGAGNGFGYWEIAEQMEAAGQLDVKRAADPPPCAYMKANRNYVRLTN